MPNPRLTALAAALLLSSCLDQAVDHEPPTVPAEVTATLTQDGEVLVAWGAAEDANLGVGGYRLLRDGAERAVTGRDQREYLDAAVTPGATHTYAVQAFDLASPPNFSEASPPAQVTIPASAP